MPLLVNLRHLEAHNVHLEGELPVEELDLDTHDEAIQAKEPLRYDFVVEKLEAGPKGAVIALRDNRFGNPAGLVDLIQRNAGTLRLRPDQKIVYLRNWDDAKARLTGQFVQPGVVPHLCENFIRLARVHFTSS